MYIGNKQNECPVHCTEFTDNSKEGSHYSQQDHARIGKAYLGHRPDWNTDVFGCRLRPYPHIRRCQQEVGQMGQMVTCLFPRVAEHSDNLPQTRAPRARTRPLDFQKSTNDGTAPVRSNFPRTEVEGMPRPSNGQVMEWVVSGVMARQSRPVPPHAIRELTPGHRWGPLHR